MDDNQLIVALKEDDKDAFRFLFDKYYGSLVGYINIYCKSREQSEDIVQHSFLTLWKKRYQLEKGNSPKKYLYTIAYNRHIDLYRKSVRKRDFLEELRFENLNNRIEEDTDVLERRLARLRKIIDGLPPRCKEILILSRKRGLEYIEIANQLNISPRTVEEQIRIAFKKIRKAFDDESLLLFYLFKKLGRLRY